MSILDLTEKDLEGDSEVLGQKIIQLAEIVMRKHFYASYNEREDLISVGVLKAYTLIEKGQWRSGRGAFYNYIYAGMRNDMHNYLYHQNKEALMDENSDLDKSTVDEYLADEVYNLDFSVVDSICKYFSNIYGLWIYVEVIKSLEDLGFKIINKPLDSKFQSYNSNSVKYSRDVLEDIVGRLIGLIMWKRKEWLS